MTDVPPGQGRPEDDSSEPYEPSGARRSTFTPPTGEQPAFDDDALAAALAAQVSSYTAPVPVVGPDGPVAAEPPAVRSAPAEPTAVRSAPAEPTAEAPSSTLEAIERLENELRRRAESVRPGGAPTGPTPLAPVDPESVANGETGPVPGYAAPAAPAPLPDGERMFPAPPSYLRPAPPEQEVPAGPPTVWEVPPEEAPGAPVWDLTPPAPAPAPPVLAPEPPVAQPEPPEFAPPPAFATPEPPTFAPQPAPEAPAWDLTPPPAPEAPAWDLTPPPTAVPPPLVEPPASPFVPPPADIPAPSPAPPAAPATGSFALPPSSPAVDLPPPGPDGPTDFSHLPPPVGLEPAAIPPYEPSPAAPSPSAHDDFASLLGGPGAAAVAPAPGDEDDVVDDVDRVFGTGAIAVDSTGAVHVVAPPSQPIPTLSVVEGEDDLLDPEPTHHPALAVEDAGIEPTPLDLRAGRSARLFWLNFAANSSVVSLSLGAVLFGLGMSLRQALVAILIGVALSFLPLGFVTLAGKWSGQPTMVVSRAMFGRAGNAVPTVVAVLSRVFWGGALLWVLAAGVARVLVDAGLDAGLGEQIWTLVGLAAGFVLAFVVAFLGYGLLARVQLVLSILTGVLVVGVIAITSPYLDLTAAQDVSDGPWALLLSGAVLVFSFVGLAWVHSAGDVARYQRLDSDGGSSMLWSTFGATLPAFALIGWGALLAASDPIIADGLATNPLHTIAALLPIWYPAPLLAALGLGLISGIVLTIYSGGFALQALGLPVRRALATVLAGVLVLGAAAALLFLAVDARGLIREVATTIAVPIAAWAGIFAAEMMIRRRRFHTGSLLRAGGIYPPVRWGNLAGLVVVSAIGFGLTSSTIAGLDWQGYLLPYLGLGEEPLASSDVGVLVALVLGILVPLVTGVPAIRRQERTSRDDLDAP